MQDDGRLVEMTEQEYFTEDLLQQLLAKHPNLLAGDQMSSGEPRRWLLISREMGVPAEEDGGDQWSVDHLFLDQDAIPTIVEVKRGTDTHIRREVVGQMLDCVANAVAYWPMDRLRVRFEEGHEDPEQRLIDILGGPDADLEDFWQKVKTNLQAGRMRLIFVADKIPVRLRRIVEFLNQQMDPAEVLAVEIKQYVGGNMKTLVPHIIGQTVEAQEKKSGGTPRQTRKWDEATFLQELEARAPEVSKPIRAIYEWATNKMSRITWGKGAQYGTFYAVVDQEGIEYKPITLWTDGYLYMQFGYIRNIPPFDKYSNRLELLHRLNEIPDVTINEEAVDKYPSISLLGFKDESALRGFLEVLDWFVQEVKAT